MGKNYDLKLPQWGPYNKIYLGGAHVADKKRGLRFDLSLFPGYYRRSVMMPRDLSDCGAKMMAASPDLSRFVYRYELEWKDKVYIDADFCSDNNVLTVTCDFVNNTGFSESLTLNAVMSMHCCTQIHNEIHPVFPVDLSRWVDAVDYSEIKSGQFVASDGLYNSEKRESGFVGGSFISSDYFGANGNFLKYKLEPVCTEAIGIRYRGAGSFTLKTDGSEYEVSLPKADEISIFELKIKEEKLCGFEIFPHDSKIDFDGFFIGGEAEVYDEKELLKPEVSPLENGAMMKFGDISYTAECDGPFVLRTLNTDDIGQLLSTSVHDHVGRVLGNGGRECVDLFVRPVFIEPNSKKRVIIKITAPEGKGFEGKPELYEPVCNPSGERYLLSQKIMSAVTLTNVVWPVYSRRGFIRHNTPGRNWDSLYTWDSGFIGMGLSEIDISRAKDCLNSYMTPEGDRHSPYIFHGTPLPTQIFLYAKIFSKTGDIEFLKEFYPGIRQQYRFFADMRKTGRIKKSGMFALWDIFYNSGGWDDYPTQKYVHDNGLEEDVCPVINTAMTVLCGKILKNLAGIAGFDTAEYDEDIAFYSDAVNQNAWDEESGYYGYVCDDGILKINGVNGDMGLDGAFPYIAGISNEERGARILDNIKRGMVTDIGVSVVDRRAPYYRNDGYWNGSVWMPHQWILWKALLDNGETDFALEIALKALELWERETSLTYNCYEHFMIENGRGAGFHQFSGLSTPVLMWFSALFKPYTVTSGFLTLITEKTNSGREFSFRVSAVGAKPAVIVCLKEGGKYSFETSGDVKQINPGTYIISYNSPVDEKIFIKEV